MNAATKLMVIQSGRSWWQARYRDGKIRSEWETLMGMGKQRIIVPVPVGGRTSQWEEVDKKGMVGLRLVCPNGQIAELECSTEYRFIQLKSGKFQPGIGQFCDAHIIGAVDDDGSVKCFAYETAPRKVVQFTDNIYNFKYIGGGALSLEVQGVRL